MTPMTLDVKIGGMFQLEIDLIAIIVLAIGGIIAFVRVQSQQTFQKEELKRLEAKQALDHANLQAAQEKELSAFKAAQAEREKAIWDRFESLQHTLITIVQQLGRVEGKIDSKE